MEVGKDLTTKTQQSCALMSHVLAAMINLLAVLKIQTAPSNALKHMNSNAMVFGLTETHVLPIPVHHPQQDLAVNFHLEMDTNAMMMSFRQTVIH
tara:strand:+ start:289 stop:573 length:285 start_codon:yes stop_codon:yes gene_type:complete